MLKYKYLQSGERWLAPDNNGFTVSPTDEMVYYDAVFEIKKEIPAFLPSVPQDVIEGFA